MAAKKAQMFVVTAIFLATTLFVIQQAFITYSALDISSPYRTKQLYVLNNVINSVNETIRTSADCPDLERNMDELLDVLKDDISKEGIVLDSDYVFNDCVANWNNLPSSGIPPMRLSLRLSETYDISGNVLDFYHNQ
ncbi:MAG: hypothetical protein JSV63_02130 [Candidatus Aenigmatarchaeota archaeon]|nr:MAG: hypothetical protein JSV63_02130 [Candidatus Aenigmarchaeota archaeon]